MIVEALRTGIIYISIVLSLFAVDFLLGNGFIVIFQKTFCKLYCFVRKVIREEAMLAEMAEPVNPINMPMLFVEFVVLSVTVMFLNKYKECRGKDRIDELLQDSKEALKQTNEFLEKWRLRRVPTEYSYLDEEPQEIKPIKLEVPILHMAIIDTLGTRRSQPERGDAGDTISYTDSALLSVTSLLDEDQDFMTEPPSDEKLQETNSRNRFNNRYLWDVLEEDTSLDDY